MRRVHDLGELEWTISGWIPHIWRQQRSIEAGVSDNAEVSGVPARVPGSVQGALRAAGIIPDWNIGVQARDCEWVENRHWIFTARIPEGWLHEGPIVRLRALGLDYSGWVLLNGQEIGSFRGSFVPWVFDLSGRQRAGENTLQIVFDTPPRWLGQIGYTSRITEWKPRFNYWWDWTSRLVQIGIWDALSLEVTDGEEIVAPTISVGADMASGMGRLRLAGTIVGRRGTVVRLTLRNEQAIVCEEVIPADAFCAGHRWDDLPVALWWPNGAGAQPLYTLRCRLEDRNGTVLDEVSRRIGFREIRWEPCAGAPAEADPWICVVNGRPIFLQGVNWTPILPNFADVSDERYRHLLTTYRDLGCTMLRVWGGAFLEKEIFYDLCDELGLLVWQDFPLSSSGLENWPPEDGAAIEELAEIAESSIQRRRHHASLALWCGGNELTGPNDEGNVPVGMSHPLIARLARVTTQHDPERRFLATTPSGPSFGAEEKRFGLGVHWDVHGPWRPEGPLDEQWTRYWANNDGLFHSEIGAPGASSAAIIRWTKGDLDELPGTAANPLWRRQSWWIEWPAFVEELGREPATLEEYVAWSQERQRRALGIAARSAKGRFPRCGGFLLWMGHDSFPCTANTSIIDFWGERKPAAGEIGAIFRGDRP
jgi:beta-mannosidase